VESPIDKQINIFLILSL